MAQVGIPYEMIGPDGTRAVVGNSAEAMADPDFCGLLNGDGGVVGLLDTAAHRPSVSDLVERDGRSSGKTFLGGRSGTVNILLPSFIDIEARNAIEAKLKRATRALRADGIFRYTPSGEGSPRMLHFRRDDGPRFAGRGPYTCQITLSSDDPFVLSATEDNQVLTPDLAAGELGIQNPITNPITSETSVSGALSIVNGGDAPTWPRFRIDGPITNPVLLNNTTGRQIALSIDVAAGEFLDVYPQTGQVLLGGTANRYNAVTGVPDWWQLEPGSNDVRLLSSAYSTGAQVTVYWRNAWE